MTRGEVWWADLAPRSGSEQRDCRPIVVMSSDAFNTVPTWRSVVVVPLTTFERQLRIGPSAIAVPAHAAQLPSASVALCHQIATLERPTDGQPTMPGLARTPLGDLMVR